MTDYLLPILLPILSFLLPVAGGIVFALWRHKQTGVGPVELVGLEGRTHTDLDPEGSVIVHGELWAARSVDGTSIAAEERVKVTRVEGHLLLVKRDS